jgi:hypothetical protein
MISYLAPAQVGIPPIKYANRIDSCLQTKKHLRYEDLKIDKEYWKERGSEWKWDEIGKTRRKEVNGKERIFFQLFVKRSE